MVRFCNKSSRERSLIRISNVVLTRRAANSLAHVTKTEIIIGPIVLAKDTDGPRVVSACQRIYAD